jgi:CRP/FNR family cyclic AMP-dependent transcriptional regulator
MSEKYWYLKKCSLFERLDDQQLQQIEAHSRSKDFPANTPVYLPAEKADHVFLLAKGLVKVSHLTADAKESILAFVESGELFGELALFDGQSRDELVKTMEPSTVVMIPAARLQQLMADSTDVALAITKLVGLRRQRIERRLKNLLFLSNRDRLVHLLLELAEQYGVSTDDGVRLRIKLSHQELANLIGSTRETVTVVLGQLRAQDCVAGGRRKIVITQPERLAQSVDRQPPHAPRLNPRRAPVLWAG